MITPPPLSSPAAFSPPLRLKDAEGPALIGTLDEALVFAERNPRPEGDYEGMIRRLQGAHVAEDRIEAANAFRWWCEANGLLADAAG